MTVITRLEAHSPRYRYFTADLLTDEILAEIPFSGVSYERSVKAAGAFTGTIPITVTESNRAMNLYDSTMPANTALYVVRDGVCVWGGVIWDRDWTLGSAIQVSATEFTSLFHKRRIWKTWNHQFGATVTVANGSANVKFDYGSLANINPGSSVKLEFYEPVNFPYNGFYRVAGSPVPDKYGFTIDGARSTVDIVSVNSTTVSSSQYTVFQTDGPHGFSHLDTVTVYIGPGSPYNGTFVINTTQTTSNQFMVYTPTLPVTGLTTVQGTATRPIANGVYTNVTVSVRADSYDYIRSLVQATFDDFTGIDFPNEYIEPGIKYEIDIIQYSLSGGLASITTSNPHGLVAGQIVQIKDLNSLFNGEFEVYDVPAPTQFRYRSSGYVDISSATPRMMTIAYRGVNAGSVYMATTVPHGFVEGQTIYVTSGRDVEGNRREYNGSFVIDKIVNKTTFAYKVTDSTTQVSTLSHGSPVMLRTGDAVGQTVVEASVQNNVATLYSTTDLRPLYAVGDPLNATAIWLQIPLARLDYTAATSTATITTATPHGLQVGDIVANFVYSEPVKVIGFEVAGGAAWNGFGIARSYVYTTEQPHPFTVGSSVQPAFDNQDTYEIASYSISSGQATITTTTPHNLGGVSSPNFSNLLKQFSVSYVSLADNIATITTPVAHGFSANDEITVAGIDSLGIVRTKEIKQGTATLTFSERHNFVENSPITISGVGSPFDGTYTILSVSSTQVSYELGTTADMPITTANGTATSPSSIFNGTFIVQSTSTNTIVFGLVGNEEVTRATSGTVRGESALRGLQNVTIPSPASGTTEYTFTIPVSMPDQALTVVANIDRGNRPAPTVTTPSRFAAAITVTAATKNTFTASGSMYSATPYRSVDWLASLRYVPFGGNNYTITAVPTPTSYQYTTTAPRDVSYVPTERTPQFTVANKVLSTTTPKTITGFTSDGLGVTFALPRTTDIPRTPVAQPGYVTTRPVAVVSSFGPYPGNADVGIKFASNQYSQIDIEPTAYRGFELTNVGDALDSYSDTINGFEYRIDCAYDKTLGKFTKTFVLIPLNPPNPPPKGELSPLSRFGADKLVFEYPGNISDLKIRESAENSVTRFFAVGENDLGPDAGPAFSVAADSDLLNGTGGKRRWPLLDDDEKIDDVDSEAILYAYAKRYLSESRPPDMQISITVIGSLPPEVGSYVPGNWCSLIVDDEFIRQRLANGMEPRDDVIVRKIDSFKVTVPDGTTFPEKVDLTLVPEWEIDKRGE